MMILKVVISIIVTAFLAGSMFCSFIGGAPCPQENPSGYVFLAAAFSISLSVFSCLSIHYILHLQKRIEKLEKDAFAAANKSDCI